MYRIVLTCLFSIVSAVEFDCITNIKVEYVLRSLYAADRSVTCGDLRVCQRGLEYCNKVNDHCEKCARLCEGNDVGNKCANFCPDYQQVSRTLNLIEKIVSEQVTKGTTTITTAPFTEDPVHSDSSTEGVGITFEAGIAIGIVSGILLTLAVVLSPCVRNRCYTRPSKAYGSSGGTQGLGQVILNQNGLMYDTVVKDAQKINVECQLLPAVYPAASEFNSLLTDPDFGHGLKGASSSSQTERLGAGGKRPGVSDSAVDLIHANLHCGSHSGSQTQPKQRVQDYHPSSVAQAGTDGPQSRGDPCEHSCVRSVESFSSNLDPRYSLGWKMRREQSFSPEELATSLDQMQGRSPSDSMRDGVRQNMGREPISDSGYNSQERQRRSRAATSHLEATAIEMPQTDSTTATPTAVHYPLTVIPLAVQQQLASIGNQSGTSSADLPSPSEESLNTKNRRFHAHPTDSGMALGGAGGCALHHLNLSENAGPGSPGYKDEISLNEHWP